MMAPFGFTANVQRLITPLRRNPAAKMFALVSAFMLWFFVNAGKRETHVFHFPIELRNLPDQTVLVNRDPMETIAVTLNGPGALLASLDSQRSPITLDLSQVEPGHDVKVKIRDEMIHVPRGVRVFDVEPSRMPIRLERLKNAVLPVHLARTGKLAEGYKLSGVQVTPPRVTVSGPAKTVGELKAIDTRPVDIGGLRQRVKRTVALAPREALVSTTPERVTVQLEIEPIVESREIRDVEIQVRNVDHPFKLSPGRVTLKVRGAWEVVHDMQLGDGSVFVDGATLGPGDHRVAVEVVLPVGVELQKREPATVNLQISDRKDGERK